MMTRLFEDKLIQALLESLFTLSVQIADASRELVFRS